MKTDKEFLDGIYKKADILLSQEKNQNNKNSFLYLSAVNKKLAACIACLAVVFFIGYEILQPKMEVPEGYMNKTPIAFRMIACMDIQQAVENADLIINAKVKSIGKSVHDEKNNITTTKVDVTVKDIYKGSYDDKKLTLSIKGGYDEKTKTFVEYESVFSRREDALLFLMKTDDSYTLFGASQGKYTFNKSEGSDKIYIGTDGTVIRISELKNLIKEIGEKNEKE